MTAASMKAAIGSGLKAAWPPAMTMGSSRPRSTACSGMPGEVEGVQHVGVAELGREGQPEEVEVAHRAVAVDGELRQAALPQLCLHVGPHGIRALGEGVLTLVDDLVEDHDALVGHAHLVGVGIHQRPAGGQLLAGGPVPADVPVLDRGVQLAADVLDGLVDPFQQRLEIGPQGFTRHPSMLRARPRSASKRRPPTYAVGPASRSARRLEVAVTRRRTSRRARRGASP